MRPLSVVLITKNEEKTILGCLDSVSALASEVVVVDSGSSDATCALCRKAGARVVEADWLGFGRQKNLAVASASHDWVLCLDADERVSSELAKSIQTLQNEDHPAFTAYQFARCNRFLGRFLRHGEGYPDLSLRLFDRRYAKWSDDDVHEKVVATGSVGHLDGDLLHESAESLASYLTKQNRYTSIGAQMAFAQGKKVSASRLFFSPLVRFIKFYFVRSGWKDGLPGFVHIAIGCFNSFMKYAKLYELQASRPKVRGD